MGGLKRKNPMVKIEKKDSLAVTFSKRNKGLYSKASQLCLLHDSKIAIITTPLSSNSNASFYSFGHSSVDSVVDAFLAGTRPPSENQGSGYWWEDEGLDRSEDPEELRNALDAMKKMLQDLRMTVDKRGGREEDVKEKKKKKKNKKNSAHQKQTLNLQPSSSSASLCNPDENFDAFNKNTEEHVLAICDKSSNDEFGNLDGFGDELEVLLMSGEMNETNQNPFSDSEAFKGGELVVHRDFYENNLHDQFLAISDNSKNDGLHGNLGEFNQELDLEKMIDFDRFDDFGDDEWLCH